MEFSCNYLFVEELSTGGVKSLHPLILKLDNPSFSAKELFIPRMKYAASLPIEHLAVQPDHNDKFIIVGTGPSLDLNEIGNGKVCTINKAHDYLIKNNIVPDMHIMYESDLYTLEQSLAGIPYKKSHYTGSVNLEQSLGGLPNKGVTYYACSVSCEEVFDKLKDYKISLWHTKFHSSEYEKFVESLFPSEPNIDTPPVSFIKAIGIGRVLGYKNFELHGIDCSFPFFGSSDHINDKEELEGKLRICGKNKDNSFRRYLTTTSYLYQVIEFMNYSKDLNVKIHGEGLLGFVRD